VSTAALAGPLRHFLAQLDGPRSGDPPDMGQVGAALVELAADQEFFTPLIAQIPAGSPGVHWLTCTTTAMSPAPVPAPTR
jgi:hypothetical protein